MSTFKQLPQNNNIQELIQSTFDVNLAIAGEWGYTQDKATIITAIQKGMPISQLQHMLTSIRAHLEMNITQTKENRYAGINANEKSREENKTKHGTFNKVTYEITAINETLYTAFIKEYKEGYGKEDFNLTAHFKRRAEATVTREVIHYFEVGQLA